MCDALIFGEGRTWVDIPISLFPSSELEILWTDSADHCVPESLLKESITVIVLFRSLSAICGASIKLSAFLLAQDD